MTKRILVTIAITFGLLATLYADDAPSIDFTKTLSGNSYTLVYTPIDWGWIGNDLAWSWGPVAGVRLQDNAPTIGGRVAADWFFAGQGGSLSLRISLDGLAPQQGRFDLGLGVAIATRF